MNGQFLGGRPISVGYAFKKDTKGERHGTPAERLLAAQRKSRQVQTARPHTMFATGPKQQPQSGLDLQTPAMAAGLAASGYAAGAPMMPPPPPMMGYGGYGAGYGGFMPPGYGYGAPPPPLMYSMQVPPPPPAGGPGAGIIPPPPPPPPAAGVGAGLVAPPPPPPPPE